jgi:hypothetical protein
VKRQELTESRSATQPETGAGAPVANPPAFTEEDVSYLVRQTYSDRESLRLMATFDKLRAQRERN